MRILLAIVLFFGLLPELLAQEKAIVLPDVSITGKKAKPGQPLDSLLPIIPANTALQSLALFPEIYLKNYGPGNSASLSIRGTSANHSNILWKGMALANPMLAMNDLSILPGMLLPGARLISGGPSVNGFSGNFGGIILLDTKPNPSENGVLLGSSVGSFGDYQQWATGQGQLKSTQFSFKIWNQESKNNFPYLWDQEKRKQVHARQKNTGLLSEWTVPFGNQWIWRPALWIQMGEREISPSALEHQSDAQQFDQQLRLANEWNFQTEKQSLEIMQGFNQQVLDYQSPEKRIDSRNKSREYLVKASYKRTLQHLDLDGQFLQKYTEVFSNNYVGKAGQHQSDLLTSATWKTKEGSFWLKMQFQSLAFQNEGTNSKGILFLPGLDLGKETRYWGSFKTGIFRKARIPGLNDLFWQEVGNPDLRPEKGWSAEGNWLLNKNLSSHFQFQNRTSVFVSRIHDYIQWLPVSGHWSPDNVTEVDIRGFHLQPGLMIQWADWRIKGNAGIQFTSSIQQKARFNGDEGVGKQMMYVPRWNRVYSIDIQWKSWSCAIWAEQVGLRFTDPANESLLPSYQLVNSRISYSSSHQKKWGLDAFLEVRNLTGVSYQSVRGYPMPLQQFKLGIQIIFNTNQ